MKISDKFYELVKECVNKNKPREVDWFNKPHVKMYDLDISVEDLFDSPEQVTLEKATGLLQSHRVTRRFIETMDGTYHGVIVNCEGDIYSPKSVFNLGIFYDSRTFELTKDLIASATFMKQYIGFIVERYSEMDVDKDIPKGKFIETQYRAPISYLTETIEKMEAVWKLGGQRYEVTDAVLDFIRRDKVAMDSFRKLNKTVFDFTWDLDSNIDGEPISIIRLITENN